MPKVGMEPVRRAEAINAALECMCEVGIDAITLEMVARRAGFSKGIVAYYFKTKQQLILESLKAFMAAYRLKSQGSIQAGMTPKEMVGVIIDTSLPELVEEGPAAIQAAAASSEEISLPEKKIARLFFQFIARANTDPEIRETMTAAYQADAESIAELIAYVKASAAIQNLDEHEAAYELLAVIYGLSLFRVMGFLPQGKQDNRQIAYRLVDRWFQENQNSTQG